MPAKKYSFKSPQQLWEFLSSRLVNFVEKIFFRLGFTVAKYPWHVIAITWIFIISSCFGLLRFHIEKNPMKLWIPPESDFYQDTNWYIDNFGTGFRMQKILIVADDVLEPEILLNIYNISKRIKDLKVNYDSEQLSMEDLCFKVPVVSFYSSSSSDNNFWDPTLWVDSDFYCKFLESFPTTCLQYNILDLWKSDLQQITNTTKHEIVSKLRQIKTNPVSGHPTDYTKLLGGVKKDEHGDIVSASSVILTWYTQVNMSAVDLDEVGNLVGTEEWVSAPLALWETEFLNTLETISKNFSKMSVYYEAGRSFGDISGQSMFQEMDKLFMSIMLMFIYVVMAMSRCNWLEIKLTLSSVGLLSVGMAYVTAISWCSILGIPFGPVHSSLPFLLMGLGIDDMFVMNACWNKLTDKESEKRLPVKVGLMLKHAGVSIVITSFTDIVALLIGAITILPALKSFCIYAAMGVFFIFCFSVTFFVAIFTLDIKRMNSNRNGVLFCYQHKQTIQLSNSKTLFQRLFSYFYKNVVFTLPGKVFIIIFTVITTAFSIQAILKLQQRFDPKWFIPEDTYYKHFIDNYDIFYPDSGYAAMILLGEMNYNQEFPKLLNMTQDLKKESYVLDLDSWVESFHEYVLKRYNRDLAIPFALTDNEFYTHLSKFLFSPIGGRFQINFRFRSQLHCGSSATNITASSMLFRFSSFQGPDEYIPAMNKVKHVVKSVDFTTSDGYQSVWSKAFANWVTDEIIAVEVERNIELALLCVMCCTVILITNLQMCFWIFLCVLLTIVNVLGYMQIWGMTVDIVCCIGLELAIGLCVDYAAHLGHTFLTTTEGSREERAFSTVTSIGVAVLQGGGSTFLALSLLSLSKTYTFKSFFKIFFLVIIFGLFNGLFFLPVILSLIGPKGYTEVENKGKSKEKVELNGDTKQALTEMQIEDPTM